MSQLTRKILGIDLGTTYSCMAYLDEYGKPVVLKNSEGESITPSVVFFDGDRITVGSVAKENAVIYPDDVVSFVKRSIGKPNVSLEYGGIVRTPEEISSYIIKKLVRDASQQLGEEIQDVVITCPAYFGINEREATRAAGEIAGLNVLHIINEPTAAAIAYGMAEQEGEKVVMVYDLGGGTFDVTLIKLTADEIEVICTGGDHQLGGKDWDDRIVRYLAQQFEEKTGNKGILDDPESCQDLQLQAEKIKKTLTQRDKAPANITHDGERVKVELTRETFQNLTDDLLERTLSLTQQMLDAARQKGVNGFDELLLVGGSTRMPQIAERLKVSFPQHESKLFDPDESVAKGAAIFGWKSLISDELLKRIQQASGDSETKTPHKFLASQSVDPELLAQLTQDLAQETGMRLDAIGLQKKITNVSSKSFGIIALSSREKEKVFHLILRNTAVPASVTKDFYTIADNQANVLIQIMEDELDQEEIEVAQSHQIGKAVLELPAGLPAESTITLTYQLNTEGRLEIDGVHQDSGAKVQAVVQTRSVISGEEKNKAQERHAQTVWT